MYRSSFVRTSSKIYCNTDTLMNDNKLYFGTTSVNIVCVGLKIFIFRANSDEH